MRLFWFSASPVFGGSTPGAQSPDNSGHLGSIAQLASFRLSSWPRLDEN